MTSMTKDGGKHQFTAFGAKLAYTFRFLDDLVKWIKAAAKKPNIILIKKLWLKVSATFAQEIELEYWRAEIEDEPVDGVNDEWK